MLAPALATSSAAGMIRCYQFYNNIWRLASRYGGFRIQVKYFGAPGLARGLLLTTLLSHAATAAGSLDGQQLYAALRLSC